MDGLIVKKIGTMDTIIVGFPVFLANNCSLGFDWLKNPLAPLLLFFGGS
jgi:hypothetical protein